MLTRAASDIAHNRRPRLASDNFERTVPMQIVISLRKDVPPDFWAPGSGGPDRSRRSACQPRWLFPGHDHHSGSRTARSGLHRGSGKPVRPVQRWRSIMRQLCGWPYGGYNAKHVGSPVVAGDHLPESLLAESINELDRLIGTRGFISGRPLELLRTRDQSAIGGTESGRNAQIAFPAN